jgi:hypothetical protein
MEIGARKLTKVSKNRYSYTNSIGEVFYLFRVSGGGYKVEKPAIYWERGSPNNVFVNAGELEWKLYKAKTFTYTKYIAAASDFSDMGKTPGSMIIIMNKWYQKYGYPETTNEE